MDCNIEIVEKGEENIFIIFEEGNVFLIKK